MLHNYKDTALGNEIVLTNQEIDHVYTLIDPLLDQFKVNYQTPAFLNEMSILAYDLPKRLVRYLTDFKYKPHKSGVCVIKGFPLDDQELGATPEHWALDSNNNTCWRHCMLSMLCSSVLGDPFGWLTQQDSRLIHDVLPIKKYEHEQLGCGCKEELTWHTEDAFHELRGDYLVFLCLRNHDGIPTTVARPDFSLLTERELELLFAPFFTIKPDHSHLEKNESDDRAKQRQQNTDCIISSAYREMEERNKGGQLTPVLFGDKNDPYMRIDPYFMQDAVVHEEAQAALDKLIGLINSSLSDLTLNAGEIAVFDNYKVVHGRRSFQARYDGTDRWFKRINVTRDLRKSRHVRKSPDCRVVF